MLPKIIKRRARLINDAVDFCTNPDEMILIAKKGERVKLLSTLGDVILAEYNGTKFLVPKYNLE